MKPTIKGLIKIHKPNLSIRAFVNWRNAPAYRLAKLFTQKIRQLAPLPNTYNVENIGELLGKLKNTPILPHFKLASLDITNLYTNIPVMETRDILSNMLERNSLDSQTKQESIKWNDTITNQNYFTHNGKTLIQNDGLAMGAPSSGLISEIFLQPLENQHLTHLSNKHKIVSYLRYVDDTLVIFDSNHTIIQTILADFNAIHPRLKFTAEIETDKKINFLDVTIHRTTTDWRTSINVNTTYTDTIIPYTSCHPTQHKYTAVRFLYKRLNTYNLFKEDYEKEESLHHNIMHNSFPIHPRKPPTRKTRKHLDTTQTPPQKWTTFTYIGKETTFITNIFKRTNLKIDFRTNNTIGERLMHKQQITDSYTR